MTYDDNSPILQYEDVASLLMLFKAVRGARNVRWIEDDLYEALMSAAQIDESESGPFHAEFLRITSTLAAWMDGTDLVVDTPWRSMRSAPRDGSQILWAFKDSRGWRFSVINWPEYKEKFENDTNACWAPLHAPSDQARSLIPPREALEPDP